MRKLFIATLSFLSVTSAQAWNATQDFNQGFYWASLPVSMKVIDTDSNRLNLIKRLTDESVQIWQNVVVGQLWTMSAQQVASAGGNIIRWSNNFSAETGLDASSILAVTIRYTGGPYIARSEIIVNGNNIINQSEANLKTVLLHELGHTLGLDHSEYGNAVMAANLVLGYSGLHSDDRQGISAIVGETQRRQAIGYVSPLSQSEDTQSSSPLNCGTVDMSGGAGGGGGNTIVSLGIGLLLALIAAARPVKRRGK